jgi:hypothetical protein
MPYTMVAYLHFVSLVWFCYASVVCAQSNPKNEAQYITAITNAYTV